LHDAHASQQQVPSLDFNFTFVDLSQHTGHFQDFDNFTVKEAKKVAVQEIRLAF